MHAAPFSQGLLASQGLNSQFKPEKEKWQICQCLTNEHIPAAAAYYELYFLYTAG